MASRPLIPVRLLLLSALTLLVAASVHAQDAAALVGHWSLTCATANGQTRPLPPGATMVWSFMGDGTATVQTGDGQVSGSGTYTVQGGALEMTMEGQPKTLTFSAEPDRLFVDFGGTRLVFDRAAAPLPDRP